MRLNFVQKLEKFRGDELSPQNFLNLLAKHPHLLLQVAVGIGKTTLIHKIVGDEGFKNRYDKILIVVEQTKLRDELAKTLINDGHDPDKITILKSRPKSKCGDLDEKISAYEENGNSALARSLCNICHFRIACEWPSQMESKNLNKGKIVLATTEYMLIYPDFIKKISPDDGKILVLLDEAKMVTRQIKTKIKISVINRFYQIIRDIYHSPRLYEIDSFRVHILDQWLFYLEKFIKSPSRSLIYLSSLPRLIPPLPLRIQERGIQIYPRFRYVGDSLFRVGQCDPSHRWISDDGDATEYLQYPNFFGSDLLMLSANLDLEVARLRLNLPTLFEPIKSFKSIPEETRIFNVSGPSGCSYVYKKRKEQMLKMHAPLIWQMVKRGQSVLLVSKQDFINDVVDLLPRLLHELSGKEFTIIKAPFESWDKANIFHIPIIHYGILGTNAFESLDCVVCLNSYHISPQVLTSYIHETLPRTRGLEFTIKNIRGVRTALPPKGVPNFRHLDRIANKLLYQLETCVVEQAVGRVRFLTKPRVVFLFNRAIYSFPVTRNFAGLIEFRAKFELPTGRTVDKSAKTQRIKLLDSEGMTPKQIASEVGLSIKSIYRHLEQ